MYANVLELRSGFVRGARIFFIVGWVLSEFWILFRMVGVLGVVLICEKVSRHLT